MYLTLVLEIYKVEDDDNDESKLLLTNIIIYITQFSLLSFLHVINLHYLSSITIFSDIFLLVDPLSLLNLT